MQLIFKHSDFIVINKPAGLSFHGSQISQDKYSLGVADLAAKEFSYPKLWSVHRLDKMTSGLLILATNKESAQKFQVLFSERKLQKFYLALSDKKPKKKQGWIKGDMQAARRGSYKLLASQNNPAVTRFISASIMPGLRLFLLKPETGKTHQLRVALKSISAPICGDHRYQNITDAEKYDRGYLHAYALNFVWQGEPIKLSMVPEEGSLFVHEAVKAQVKKWSKPWEIFKEKGA